MSSSSAFVDLLQQLDMWWPEGDGNALRAAADGWSKTAELIDEITAVLNSVASRLTDNYRGEAADRFSETWTRWTGESGYLGVTATDCRKLAAALTDFASDIDVADRTLVQLIEQALNAAATTPNPANPMMLPQDWLMWLKASGAQLHAGVSTQTGAHTNALDADVRSCSLPPAPGDPLDLSTIIATRVSWPDPGKPIDLTRLATGEINFGAGQGISPTSPIFGSGGENSPGLVLTHRPSVPREPGDAPPVSGAVPGGSGAVPGSAGMPSNPVGTTEGPPPTTGSATPPGDPATNVATTPTGATTASPPPNSPAVVAPAAVAAGVTPVVVAAAATVAPAAVTPSSFTANAVASAAPSGAAAVVETPSNATPSTPTDVATLAGFAAERRSVRAQTIGAPAVDAQVGTPQVGASPTGSIADGATTPPTTGKDAPLTDETFDRMVDELFGKDGKAVKPPVAKPALIPPARPVPKASNGLAGNPNPSLRALTLSSVPDAVPKVSGSTGSVTFDANTAAVPAAAGVGAAAAVAAGAAKKAGSSHFPMVPLGGGGASGGDDNNEPKRRSRKHSVAPPPIVQ